MHSPTMNDAPIATVCTLRQLFAALRDLELSEEQAASAVLELLDSRHVRLVGGVGRSLAGGRPTHWH